MIEKFTFKRANLAKAYCDNLEGKGIVNAVSGLFLAGPRRVGKSTFLTGELIPEAKIRGYLTIYVDLWSNRMADPSFLIDEAIKTHLVAYQSKFGKLADKVRLKKIKLLKTFELDLSKPGFPKNITLTDALNNLIALSERPVLLVIDEAQHALTSDLGINAMFAIKSARDQINMAHSIPHLMLVLTGSNRDKLAQLVVKKDQPFFGSEITPFPLLSQDYTNILTGRINKTLAANNQFSQESIWEAFQLSGHRPEVLWQMVAQVAISHKAQSFPELLKADATLWHMQVWEEFENDFNALQPLYRIILILLIKQGRSWSPFSEESLKYYKKALHQETLSVSSVQTAVQSLREQGFIWQSSRGVYALEDESFAEWYRYTHE